MHIVDGNALALGANLFCVDKQHADRHLVLLALRADRNGRFLRQRRLAARRIGQATARGREAGRHHVGAGQQKLDRTAVNLDRRQEHRVLVQQVQRRQVRPVVVLEKDGHVFQQKDLHMLAPVSVPAPLV